MLLSVGNIYPG